MKHKLIGALIAWLMLLALAVVASAQTVTMDFPPMLIVKRGVGRWQAQREVADVTVTFPGEKKALRLMRHKAGFPAVIDPTMVRGVFRRAVDPCACSGTLEDGSLFALNLPREPIFLRGFTPVAAAMTAQGTISRPGGKVWHMTVCFPDCPTTKIDRRTRLAAGIVAVGVLKP